MGDDIAPPAAPRRGPPPGLVVLLAAALPNLWTLRLEFAKDDFSVVAGAPFVVGLTREAPRPDFARPSDLERLTPEAAAEARAALAEENYLCRPATSAWWCALRGLGGGRASPAVFRAATLALHAISAWLLYRALRRLTGTLPAALAAAWFGAAPTAHQAFAWIAATGDLLSAVLALAALAAWVRGARREGLPGVACDVLGAVALAGSFAAKESAAVLAPIVGVAYLVAARPAPRRVRRVAFVGAVAFAAVFAWRYAHLGRFLPRYPLERPLDGRLAELISAFLGQLALPYNRAPVLADLKPLLVRLAESVFGAASEGPPTTARLLAALAFLPVACGVVVGGPRTWLKAVAVSAAFVLAALPAFAMIFVDDGTFTLSRNVYHAAAAGAALVAVGLEGLSRRLRARIIALLCVPAACVALDALAHVARVELTAAAEIGARLDSVAAAAEQAGPETRLVVIDPDDDVLGAGVPLVGVGYAWAFSRAFTETPRPVERWYASDPERVAELARDELRACRFLRRGERGFVVEPRPLPAIDQPAPRFGPVADRPGAFRPERPVAARAVRAFRWRGAPLGGELRATWRTEGRSSATPPRTVVRGIFAAPGGGELMTVAPEDEDWLRDRDLVELVVEGASVEGAPEAVRDLPAIAALSAVPGGHLRAGHAPLLRFRAPFPTPSYRAVFRMQAGGAEPSLVYTVDAARLPRGPDGVLQWRLGPDDLVAADEAFGAFGRFELLDKLWAAFARPLGLKRLLVRWRLEGLGADAVVCRSPWCLFSLSGDPP